VIAEVSAHAFDAFFAWAPWVLGAVIYTCFYVAKRHETTAVPASGPAVTTYACASCGRRGTREQMSPQQHDGAVVWQCGNCAAS